MLQLEIRGEDQGNPTPDLWPPEAGHARHGRTVGCCCDDAGLGRRGATTSGGMVACGARSGSAIRCTPSLVTEPTTWIYRSEALRVRGERQRIAGWQRFYAWGCRRVLRVGGAASLGLILSELALPRPDQSSRAPRVTRCRRPVLPPT